MRGIESGGGRAKPRRRKVPPVPLVLAPEPSGVFQSARPLAKPSLGQGRVNARAQRATRRINRNVTVAPTPKLAAPTARQRQAAKDLAIRSLTGQGIRTKADVASLPARERKRANRLLGYVRTGQKYHDAASALRAGQLAPAPRDRLQSALDEMRAERFAPPHIPTVGETAKSGRALAAGRAVAAATSRGDRRLGGGSLLGLGLVNTPQINVDSLRRATMGATSLGALSPENAIAKAALRDLGGLASFPVIASVELEQAASEAAKNIPGVGAGVRAVDKWPVLGPLVGPRRGAGRFKELGKGTIDALKQDALVNAVQGNWSGANKAFHQHPLFSVLDIDAAAGIVGHGVGATARAIGSRASGTGFRGAAARFGSRVRPPVALFDEPGAPYRQRTYSGRSDRKGAQAYADKRREPVKHPDGSIVYVMDRGRRVPLLKPHTSSPLGPTEAERIARKRANFETSRPNARERMAREKSNAQTGGNIAGGRIKGRIGKRGQQIIDLVARGVIRPDHFMADVAKRRAAIEKKLAEHDAAPRGKSPYLHADEVKDARDMVATLKRFEGSRRARQQIPQIVERAQAIGRDLNAQELEGQRLGTIEAGAERTRLMDYAQSHMGARHFTEQDHGRLEQAARQVETRLRAEVDALPKGPARAAKLAQWRTARRARIAVSGREPSAVHAHEALVGEARRARSAHERAREVLRQAREQRARVLGRNEVRGGQRSMDRMRAAQVTPNRAQAVLHFIDRAMRDEDALSKASAAEARMARLRQAADAKVKRAEDGERAARKARVDAETKAAASSAPRANAALRNADGTYLSNADIEAHMRAHGVDPANVAFVSHKQHGNEAFHSRFDDSRPNLGNGPSRTGHAFERGSEGHGPDQLLAESARKATRNVKADELDHFAQGSGMRHPALVKLTRAQRDHIDSLPGYGARLAAARATGRLTPFEQRVVAHGGYFTAKEAAELATKTAADTHGKVKLMPFRAFGGSMSADTQALIRDLQHPQAAENFPGQLINDRLLMGNERGGRRQARNVVLVSADQLNHMQKQLTSAGDLERMAQALNAPFRLSVLAQPRWLTGNFVEPYLVRLPVTGSGIINIPGLINDIRIARKGQKMLRASKDPADQRLADQIEAQHFGGLFIGGRGASVRRRAGHDSPHRTVRGIAWLRDLPVLKQMVDIIHGYSQAFFRGNRELIEKWAQQAQHGQNLRRDMREMSGSMMAAMRAAGPALRDALDGLHDTAAQQRFMEKQHEVLGKYDGYGPRTRRLIQTIAPFLPWALSAARFIYWTMPAHHTILTAVLVKTGQAYNQQWEDAHTPVKGLKGGLKYALPTADGGWVDLARYTPYGLATPVLGGDLQGLTDQFAPQVSGAVAAIEGKDPFGRDLQVPVDAKHPLGKTTAAQNIEQAIYSLIESTAGPVPSLARRLREKGATPYAGSTFWAPKVKPGTSHGMSAVQRTLDPFRPTYVGGAGAAIGKDRPAGGTAGFLQRSGVGAVSAGAVSSDQEFVLRALGR